MTDQEIERIATKHIRWIKPEHGIFYDDEVLSFARAIIAAQLAAPGAPEPKKADFYCFPAGTYAIDKPAPGERQPETHWVGCPRCSGRGKFDVSYWSTEPCHECNATGMIAAGK